MASIVSKSVSNAGALRASVSVKCANCGAPENEALRLCVTCGHDLGCPNVRAANSPSHSDKLAQRFGVARANATTRAVVAEFDSFVAAVKNDSHVVVAMPPLFARGFLSDPRTLYAGYEELVGSGSRVPAAMETDANRRAVGGKVFGSYAGQIRYGVLSLDGSSLPNYGLVFLRLRDVAIQNRVTFMHENSFMFLKDSGISVLSPIPLGFVSGWHNREQLAAAKIEPALAPGNTEKDWPGLLVKQGKTRQDDRCIEAHIFDGFNADSVENVTFGGPGANREERRDIKCIQLHMAARKKKGANS
jgi:hypothetical protein